MFGILVGAENFDKMRNFNFFLIFLLLGEA